MADSVGLGDLSLGERVVGLDVPRIPTAVRTQAELIIEVTNHECLDHLDTEYADLCRRLVGNWPGSDPLRWLAGTIGSGPQVWYMRSDR
jgi:hypothetical protein